MKNIHAHSNLNEVTLLHVKNHEKKYADGLTSFIENFNQEIGTEFKEVMSFPDDAGPLNPWRSPYSFFTIFTLLRFINQLPEKLIVVVHTFPMIAFIAIARYVFNKKIIKFVIVEHRSETNRRFFILWPLDYFIYKTADCTVTVSDSAYRNLSAWLNLIPRLGGKLLKRVKVIKNGVRRSVGNLRSEFSFKKLVFIGRLHPDKDPLMLVRLGERRIVGIEKILIIGSGNLEEKIIDKLKSYEGTPIEVTSEKSSPFETIPRDSIIVVPSRTEGFGLVAAEAMINEFPLVCSNVQALVEISENGSLCWLANAGDVESFSEAIKAIINDPLEAERKVKQACKSISSKYGWSESGSQYLQLLRDH